MWIGWPLQRVLFLFLAIVFAAIFVQVTLMHSRQNFRHWAMWIPVIATPLLALNALLLVLQNAEPARIVFAVLAVAGIGGGLVGTYFHWAGVGARVDGYTWNNLMVGPPVTLPLMVSAMGVLALIALYLV